MNKIIILIFLLNISSYVITAEMSYKESDAVIEKGLIEGTLKCHSKLETPIEEFSKSPLSTSIKFMLGEVAMYNADKWLGTNMVPPVAIKKEIKKDVSEEALVQKSFNEDGSAKTNENDKDVEILSLCSFWIEPTDVQIKSTDQLKIMVSDTEWSQMNILYFLFGQYDRHLGNQVISKETGKLYLIDNSAIANVNQYVIDYSPDKKTSCAWAPIRKNDELQTEDEQSDFLEVIKNKPDLSKIHAAFDKDVDCWTKRDIDNNNCRLWNKMLWRQFYVFEKYICAPFSETINLKLFNKLHELDAETLASFWPNLPVETNEENLTQYQNLIEKFIDNTLKRKKMIIEYFEKHPENIL